MARTSYRRPLGRCFFSLAASNLGNRHQAESADDRADDEGQLDSARDGEGSTPVRDEARKKEDMERERRGESM